MAICQKPLRPYRIRSSSFVTASFLTAARMEREGTVRQMQRSGIQYSLLFVGTVDVRTSMNELAAECQEELAQSCIKLVVNGTPPNFPSGSASFCTEDAAHPTIFNSHVELNVSSKWILLVEPKRVNRFAISDVSIVCPGRDEMAPYLCFIVKTSTSAANYGRKCYVFHGGEESTDVYECLTLAFELAYSELQQQQHTHGNGTDPLPKKIEARSGVVAAIPVPIPLARRSPSTSLSTQNTNQLSSANRLDVDTALSARERAHSSSGSLEMSDERYASLTAGLFDAPWFHHLLSREEAERLLKADGEFLVRQSPNTTERQFVLSGRCNNMTEHICLVGPKGNLSSAKGEFCSIVELVEFHLATGEELLSQPYNGQTRATLRLERAVPAGDRLYGNC